MLGALLRRAPLIIALALVGGGIAAAWSLVVTPRFEATTRFAPGEASTSALPGGLASLASQFGGLSAAGGPRSLQFYAEVLTSRDLLETLLADSFPAPEDGAARPLIELLPVDGDSAARLEDAVVHLREQVLTVGVNDRTGIVGVTVVLPDGELAAQVANRLYDRFEQFNITMRRASAAERRRFAERELAAARTELQNAEAVLRDFLEGNRAGLDAPRLRFQQARLQRRIDVAQVVYQQMTQELTDARITESRDTPVFAVIQRAAPPARRSWPHRTRMTLLGLLAGGVLGALIAVALGTTAHARAVNPAAFRRFAQGGGHSS